MLSSENLRWHPNHLLGDTIGRSQQSHPTSNCASWVRREKTGNTTKTRTLQPNNINESLQMSQPHSSPLRNQREHLLLQRLGAVCVLIQLPWKKGSLPTWLRPSSSNLYASHFGRPSKLKRPFWFLRQMASKWLICSLTAHGASCSPLNDRIRSNELTLP